MATKKTPVKKVVPKTKAKTKVVAKKAQTKKVADSQSFRLTRSTTPFLTIAITRQTLYWSIIAIAVLGLGLWTIHLQNNINQIYDAIEQNQRITDSLPDPLIEAKNKESVQQPTTASE